MSGVEIGLGIAALAGTGTQVYAGIKGASSAADAARKSAQLKNLQADELLSREAINENLIRENSDRLENQFITAFGATGGQGGLGGVLQIHRQTEQNLINSSRDAGFKAYMLKQGASIESNLASDQLAASYITGAGSIIGLGGRLYGLYAKTSPNSELPKIDDSTTPRFGGSAPGKVPMKDTY